MISSLFRIVKFSLQDIVRNMSLSFMTLLILILMLLSINTLIVVRVLTQESIQTVKEQIDVSIYFHPESSDEEIKEVRDYIHSFPEVTQETFLTKEQVLESFKTHYADNEEIIASLSELDENPLGPTLVVKTREPRDYEKIIDALSVPEYENIIEAKTFGDTQTAIERIHAITTQVERFTYFLTGLFAIIAFVIIFNTIRVAIYTQRAEIGIKRLVGATNWFIRGPYFIESYIGVIFGDPSLLTNYFYGHIMTILGIEFGAVFLLTIISSGLAMRRYLRT